MSGQVYQRLLTNLYLLHLVLLEINTYDVPGHSYNNVDMTTLSLTKVQRTSGMTGSGETVDIESPTVSGVLLQANGWASTESYVDSGFGSLPNLTEVTVCVRFRLLHGGQPATLFSYYDGTAFEQLNIAIKYPNEEILVMCCAYHVHQYVKIPVKLFRWHHLCVALNIPKDTLHIVFDGQTYIKVAKRDEADTTPEESLVIGGGRFVMGQNVNLDAEWDVTQSVHGELLDFRLYNLDIPVNMMRDFTECKTESILFEPLYEFYENITSLEISGNSSVVNLELSEVCRKTYGHTVLFPERMTFDESYARCEYMKGGLAVPKNDDENTRMFDRFIVFNDQCIQGWAALYWLGLSSDLSNSTYQYLSDNTTLTYGSWLEGWSTPSEQYPCATAAAINFPYLWYVADCATLTCPVCNFTSVPRFRLRGFCRESKLDKDYYLNGYYNGRPKFEGMFFTHIVWDNLTWILRSREDEDVEANLVERRLKGYPVGLGTWKVRGDNCPDHQSKYLLTSCVDGDFTCNDGSCISLTKRCDQVTNCPDNSDELDCGILRVPSGYTPNLPPPSFDGIPLLLKIAIEITSVREFNLVGFSMQLDVIQSITWRDARLTFANLRPGDFTNQALVDEPVWRPKVSLQDAYRSPTDITMRNQVLRVNREGNPLPDEATRTREDKLYSGEDNTMKIMQQYTVHFMCQFRLQMYPFDTQRCLLVYNVTNMEQNFIFQKGGVIFSGERRLLEYKTVHEQMLGIEDGPGVVEVMLTFRNQYGYYIGNAVVPSLFMVFICYLTLLFDLHDFQDRIMVSLTSLLVLASLFSQTSQSIPKTAYLKLIDVWYICLITVDFLIVVVLVLIENLRLRATASDEPSQKTLFVKVSHRGDKKDGSFSSSGGKEKADNALWASKKLNFISMVVIPVACLTFCLVFFIMGFYEFTQTEYS